MAGFNHQVCGELDPRIGHPLPRARSFQNIPSRMERTQVRYGFSTTIEVAVQAKKWGGHKNSRPVR